MLVFTSQSLAYIAVPKTGTTAVDMALRPKADILFTKRYKHMTAQRFHVKIAPFLDDELGLRPDRFAVMRDPEEQIRSWFRYRARENTGRDTHRTGNISFDEFVLAVLSSPRPAYAKIGSQFNMLTSGKGKVLVHHLFAYEAQPLFQSFLNDRFGQDIPLKQKNVSPPVDAPLSMDVRAKIRAARAPEFALYDRLMDVGGHLQTQIG